MTIPYFRQRISGPSIGPYDRIGRNAVLDKAGKRFCGSVRNDAESQTACVYDASTNFPVVNARTNLNRSDYKGFMVHASAFSTRPAADITFVNFNGIPIADSVPFWANHAGAEFVKDLKGRLIAGNAQLTLKLDSGLSGRFRSHQICAPEPRRKRRVARLHYGSGCQRRIGFAFSASEYDRRTSWETIWFSGCSAFRADKLVRPPHRFKVSGASFIVRKHLLKFGKGSGESALIHATRYSASHGFCQETG